MNRSLRIKQLLIIAGTLAVVQWVLLPLVTSQNEQIARNKSLNQQLQKAKQRILHLPTLEEQRQRLLELSEAAAAERLVPDPARLIEEQRALEEALGEAGLTLNSFEWAVELPAAGALRKKQAVLSVSGKPEQLARGALALAQRQPLTRLVAMQLRNASRGGSGVLLSGTLTTEVLVMDSMLESQR